MELGDGKLSTAGVFHTESSRVSVWSGVLAERLAWVVFKALLVDEIS